MNSTTKRGQAAGAAVLIAIIAGLLIMFIVLVSPEERAQLLGEDDSDNTTDSESDIDGAPVEKNLLQVSPGRVDYLAQREIEHPLPAINVYTKTEGQVLAEKNLAYAKKGVFSEEVSKFSFSVPDLQNTENLLLSLTVNSLEGRLIISLNGDEVFNGEPGSGAIQPITIPRSALNADNQIVFSVSSPGLAFWTTNEMSLANIKVIGDVTDVGAQMAKHSFLMSETERQNLEKAVLKFQPNCRYGEVGKLKISVNYNEVYNAIPDCDLALVPIEFSSSLLQEGENQIVFVVEEGTYLLSHVLIESRLKEVDFPTYYFEVSHEEYEQVRDEERGLRLGLSFVDVVDIKRGEVVFNGKRKHFDTKEASFTADLGGDVVQGTNAVKIKPRKTIEIRELRVDLLE